MQNQTESILDFDIADFETLPPGQYIAAFKDVQKTKHEQWGDGVMFCFEIATGPHKGQIATRIGKPNATKQNATGKLIMGITGHHEVGRVSLKPFIGQYYNVLMETTQGGKTRIGQVWPYKRQQQSMPVSQSMPVMQQESDSVFDGGGDIPF